MMPELKDPAIKLFGKTIQLSPDVVLPKIKMVSKPDPTDPEEKPPKPDKILPCPRCKSDDTKFCYYNNYNVNQPRHFCRDCQRYWTAGGSMRNTPVGSGRRKNKSFSSASCYRHLVLDFGESMNESLNLSDSFNSGSRKLPNYPLQMNQIPCFPPPQLCHPWSSAQFRHDSGFPMNFYPMPHCWGWSMPIPMEMTLMNMNPNSSPLGKHYRDSESSRIDDPNKAAKSSLTSSLTVSKDGNGSDPINGVVLSKAFQSKIDDVVGSSWDSLQANPAALSRSLSFWET